MALATRPSHEIPRFIKYKIPFLPLLLLKLKADEVIWTVSRTGQYTTTHTWETFRNRGNSMGF